MTSPIAGTQNTEDKCQLLLQHDVVLDSAHGTTFFLHTCSKNRRLPVQQAALHAHPRLVALLLGARPEDVGCMSNLHLIAMHVGTRYWQPVEGSHCGITHAHVMLKAILDASGDLNLACEDTGDTALHLAASRGRASLVKILLKAGAALYCSPFVSIAN